MADPAALRGVIEAAPFHEGLIAATGRADGPALDLQDVRPVHRAFAPMVRSLAYDVSELAVVTALQAFEAGRPIALLPAVVAARRQRGCLVTRADSSITDPSQLRGARVGVRAYTQTTGMWVRQHLAEDFGLTAEQLHWITKDEAHVAEYQDPPFVERELTGSVVDALRDGQVDAAILGNDLPAGEFVPVIDDAEARDKKWCRSHGYVPVNHLVVVSAATLRERPAAVRAVYAALLQIHEQVPSSAERPAPSRFGVPALRVPIEEVVATCVDQRLLAHSYSVADLFAPATELLDLHR